MLQKLIILDRDGVINYDSSEYIKTPEEWQPIPGSLDAISRLNKANYKVVVATNQSGIGRGLFSEETLQAIHSKMQAAVQKVGGHIDAIFYCPHHPQDQCSCRKPQPGLFYQIAKHYDCDLKGVLAIGDQERDVEAAVAVGCKPILIHTNNSKVDKTSKFQDIMTFPNLGLAVERLLRDEDG